MLERSQTVVPVNRRPGKSIPRQRLVKDGAPTTKRRSVRRPAASSHAPPSTRAAKRRPAPPVPADETSEASKHLNTLARRIRVCTRCPLWKSRTIAVPGEGKSTAKVMLIGEGPGKQEDESGCPFVGSAGKYLDHVLKDTRFTRADFFITNIVKCRPPGNRTPKMLEVDTCTSLYLFKQIALVQPKLVMLLGSTAVKKLLGFKSVEEARGRIIERDGRKYLASYHPAVRFYREDLAQKIKEDFRLLTRELSGL